MLVVVCRWGFAGDTSCRFSCWFDCCRRAWNSIAKITRFLALDHHFDFAALTHPRSHFLRTASRSRIIVPAFGRIAVVHTIQLGYVFL